MPAARLIGIPATGPARDIASRLLTNHTSNIHTRHMTSSSRSSGSGKPGSELSAVGLVIWVAG